MIEQTLARVHKRACRAIFLIGVMLVKRTMNRAWVKEAIGELLASAAELEKL